MKKIIKTFKKWNKYWKFIEKERLEAMKYCGRGFFSLLLVITLSSCEKELLIEQVCCDWDAVNFDPEYNGHNVNQLYFTGSNLCNNDLCIYP